MFDGTSMPWNIMFVTHSRCGSGFFSTPRMLPWSCSSSSASLTYFVRTWSMVQVRKPPVPQAGSSTVSPSLGSTWSTMNCVTARGV